MEVYLSKRKTLISLLVVIIIAGIMLVFLKFGGRGIARAVGFDSARKAALAGAEAFYNVDYHV